MNDQTDQIDEEILSDTISDEALEAVAGTERGFHATHIACTYGFCTVTTRLQ